jgi:hypothetical protein
MSAAHKNRRPCGRLACGTWAGLAPWTPQQALFLWEGALPGGWCNVILGKPEGDEAQTDLRHAGTGQANGH